MSLGPELQDYDRQFAAIRQDAQRLLDGLSPGALEWRPRAGTWSIAECLNHLVLTGRQSLDHIRRAIQNARARGLVAEGPFRHPLIGRWFVALMDAPPRVRFRVPAAYRPAPQTPPSEIVPAFLRLQDELAQALGDADGLDLARIKVANPVTSWFTLTLGLEFALTAAHERRHLWQAWRVREKLKLGRN